MIWIRGLVTEVKGNYLRLKTESEEVDCYIRVGIKTKPKQGTKICCLGRYTRFNNNDYFSFKAFKELEDSEKQTKEAPKQTKERKEEPKPKKETEPQLTGIEKIEQIHSDLLARWNGILETEGGEEIEIQYFEVDSKASLTKTIRVPKGWDSLNILRKKIGSIYEVDGVAEVDKNEFLSSLHKKLLSRQKWTEQKGRLVVGLLDIYKFRGYEYREVTAANSLSMDQIRRVLGVAEDAYEGKQFKTKDIALQYAEKQGKPYLKVRRISIKIKPENSPLSAEDYERKKAAARRRRARARRAGR